MRYARGLITLCIAFVIGCGGGGGGPQIQPLETTQLRSYRVGEIWNYDVTGTMTRAGSTTAQPITGTAIIAIGSKIVNGASVLDRSVQYSLSAPVPALAGNSVDYFVQNASTEDITLVGTYQDGDLSVTNPQTVEPGAWRQGVSFQRNFSYANGAVETRSFVLVGQQQITILRGSYPVWKVAKASSFSNQGVTESDNETIYYQPALGEAVEYTAVITLANGDTLSLVAILRDILPAVDPP